MPDGAPTLRVCWLCGGAAAPLIERLLSARPCTVTGEVGVLALVERKHRHTGLVAPGLAFPAARSRVACCR